MSRFDRCSICEYSEFEGSPVSGAPPGQNGEVARYPFGLHCDICARAIRINRRSLELRAEEKEQERLDETAMGSSKT